MNIGESNQLVCAGLSATSRLADTVLVSQMAGASEELPGAT
jgi:hypothetical protein